MRGLGGCDHAARVSHSTSAIFGGVAVEQFDPLAAVRDADGITGAGHGREVEDAEDRLAGVFALAQKREGAAHHIVAIHPFKAGVVGVEDMHGRLIAIEAVELLDPRLHPAVQGIAEGGPIQFAFMCPFPPLGDLAAHEQHFLGRLGKHIGEQQPQVGKTLPVVARHFLDERSLAVYDFIVRKRQHEVFMPGIQHAEGELAVMELAVDGVFGKILQRVVHPSHVPLHAKTQPAEIDRPGDLRPRG